MGFFSSADHTENIEIDVRPLARKVDEVTSSVHGTNNAVIAMEAAVVAQEIESANQICQNVNYGFYSLISSQISQKLAIQENAANSKLALMQSLAKKIDEVRCTAERDYQRISRRYIETFKTLDKNLKNRITELNKPAVQLSDKKKSLIFKNTLKNVANAICYAKETQPVSQMFINAELKKHANLALEALSSNLEEEKDYESKMGPIMCNGQISDVNMKFVPVVVSEVDSLNQQNVSMWQTMLPQAQMLKERNVISAACVAGAKEMAWQKASEDKKNNLLEEMTKLPEYSALDARVAGEVKKLLSQSDLDSCLSGGDA